MIRNNVTGQYMVRRISPASDYPLLCRIASIRHPNLMAIYAVVQESGVCVSICEFINGINLEQYIEQHGTMKIKQAKKLMCQVCDGLTALHKNGIVHRDIKPENIMLDQSGVAKIIDYNIARIINPNAGRDTQLFGTPGYASPEQFGFAQTSERSDIFACGVLLNYLLTGKLPAEERHTGVFESIIEKCIEIDENKRFATAEELKQVLQGKRINRRRRFRPLPGYRSKKFVPGCFTTGAIFCWFFAVWIIFTDYIPKWIAKPMYYKDEIAGYTACMVFWSLIPYFVFGDIFRMSEKINPDNPKNGKYVLCIIGFLSIAAGIALIIGVSQI